MENKYKYWTKDAIFQEMELMQERLRELEDEYFSKESLERNIDGLTVKDIAVRYERDEGNWEDNVINYSFYVKKDGKLLDFYYEWNGDEVFEFIPDGFSEACENSYEFDGTFKEAVDKLKKYGITDIAESEE